MSFLSKLKEIGAVITWPFTHAQKIEEVYAAVRVDLPPTVVDCKELAKLFLAAGPDVLAAIAAKGFDLSDDVKSAIDIKGIATYAKDTLLPQLEKDFSDLKLAALGELPAPAPAPAAPAAQAAADPAPAASAVSAANDPLRVSPNARPSASGAPLAPA